VELAQSSPRIHESFQITINLLFQPSFSSDGTWFVAEVALLEDDRTFVGVKTAYGADLTPLFELGWECTMGDGGATYVVKKSEISE
jgi:hypothetical protein